MTLRVGLHPDWEERFWEELQELDASVVSARAHLVAYLEDRTELLRAKADSLRQQHTDSVTGRWLHELEQEKPKEEQDADVKNTASQAEQLFRMIQYRLHGPANDR